MNAMQNPIALITGASKRLGAAIAKKLHHHQIDVIIHYRDSKSDAETLTATLNEQRSNSAFMVQADLNDHQQVINLAQQVISIDERVNILVNNASTFYPSPIKTANLTQWHELFASNCQAPYFLSQQLLPALKQQQGCIINMIDIHAQRPLKNYSIYCMAKSSLQTMTTAMAKELAPHIRVNGIAPGAILWPGMINEKEKQAVIDSIPMERLGTTTDIADAAFFLTQASYITGQILVVDGGRSL